MTNVQNLFEPRAWYEVDSVDHTEAREDAGFDPDDQYPHAWESHTEFAGSAPLVVIV